MACTKCGKKAKEATKTVNNKTVIADKNQIIINGTVYVKR